MDKRKDPSSVDIKSILLDMRKYRMGLIQTPDQLRFSYLAVLEGSKYIKGDASVQVLAPRSHCYQFTYSILPCAAPFLFHFISCFHRNPETVFQHNGPVGISSSEKD